MGRFDSPRGFAIRRNGSCLPDECSTNAGKDPTTNQHFYRCCPSNSVCTDTYTGACCPDNGNCTQQISEPAHCADETWDLYENNPGGFFCCEQGEFGFNRSSGTVGCGTKEELMIDIRTALSILSPGVSQTSTENNALSTGSSSVDAGSPASNNDTEPSSSASSYSSPTFSSSATSTGSSGSSGTNKGAIAGGVVGGVAGLAIIVGLLWFFMRRRTHKQSPPAQLPTNEMSMGQHQSQPHGVPSELDGHQAVELDGQRSVSELPSCKENTLHELPVMEKGQ